MTCKICFRYYNKNDSLSYKNMIIRNKIQTILPDDKTKTVRQNAKQKIKLLNCICPDCMKKLYKNINDYIIDYIEERSVL